MKKIKKIIALIICLVLSLGVYAYAEDIQLISAPVKDYEGHWAQSTIQKWMDEGRVSGYPDGSYKPDNKVSRAEFVKMVNGIIAYNKMGDITYKDVTANEWYYDHVRIAQKLGYISGYTKDSFGPNDYITREQAASIVARIQYLYNNASGIEKFTDKNNISTWAVDSVGAASLAGFISGYVDGSFQPQKNLTRAEALTMLDNVLVNSKNFIIYEDGEVINKVIEGNLIIANTVLNDTIKLTGMEIKGNVDIYGQGKNTVYFNKVKAPKINVFNKDTILIFDDGTTIQEVNINGKSYIENKNGKISRVVITSDEDATLKGSFNQVFASGKGNIILDDATIENLIVEKQIKILGKGKINNLAANSDGILYDSTVEVKKIVLGTGVTVKPEVIPAEPISGGGGGSIGPVLPPKNPNIQIIIKTADETTGKPFNSKEYEATDKFAEFLVKEAKSIFNDTSNSSVMNNYITKINDRIGGITVNGIDLYSDEGWDLAIEYIEGTKTYADVESMKDKILDSDKINKDDINDTLKLLSDLQDKMDNDDITTIVENLTKLDESDIKYNSSEVQYKLTYKSTNLTKISEISSFVMEELLFTNKTVKQFFDTYGDIVFTATYGIKTATVTIKSVTLE